MWLSTMRKLSGGRIMWWISVRGRGGMAARWWHSRYGGSFLRELVLVVALLLLYKYGRFLTKGHVDTALHNATLCLEAGVHCVMGTTGADFGDRAR